MNNRRPAILFFDSGVGGLSIYNEVKQLLPDCHYLYCFDNAFFPYSEKSEQDIVQRTSLICQQINLQYPLDLIVIACNTASTVVLPHLRSIFTIPIVGTVPAIKPAAQISQTQHIGLLATKGTVKRQYVADLVKNYAPHCQVEMLGSTFLVEMAERKLNGFSVDLVALCYELRSWQSINNLDTVILGCTHFPLIKQEIQHCLPQVKYFIDSGKAIATRVNSLLNDKLTFSKGENIVYYTKVLSDKLTLWNTLQQMGFTRLEYLSI